MGQSSQDSPCSSLLALGGLALLTALSASAAPRLTVLITVEQLRSDVLERYAEDFGPGGFRLLQESGATYRSCRVDALPTLAAPAAATLATGAPPSLHGIVGERWYERASREVVSAVETGGVIGPRRLVGSTLADELTLAYPGRSRVFAVSGGAAAAVLLAGRTPAGCFWQASDGAFVTSSYYGSAPDWVPSFNQRLAAARADRTEWRAAEATAAAPPLRSLTGEAAEVLYASSPFATEDVFDFARTAIEQEGLGRGEYPDLLIVNLGASALLAVETGARSPLMRDLFIQLDRGLAAFLSRLDDTLGLQNVAVVLTGLHGTPPGHDDRRIAGLPGGAVSGEDVAKAAAEGLGLQSGTRLAKFVYPHLYFDPTYAGLDDSRRTEANRRAADGAARIEGVLGYYSPLGDNLPPALAERLAESYFPGRSGDLLLSYAPYFGEVIAGGRGVSAGSPYRYDTDVPLIFFGQGIRPGVHQEPVALSSVAPTLAALLEISAPSSATGAVLADVLAPEPQPVMGPPSPVAP